jgi:hypothetical protein
MLFSIFIPSESIKTAETPHKNPPKIKHADFRSYMDL